MSLLVVNATEKRIRVDDVRLVYPGRSEPGLGVFAAAGSPLPVEIEGGSRESFPGLCLVPPAGADHVRFELSLSVRRGLKRERREQAFEVALRDPGSPLVLDLPFTGAWRVTQGHDCSTQHRRGKLGGEFAWDFAAVGRTPVSHRNEESTTFGRDVLAPVAGTVVEAVDGVPDNDEQREFPRKSLVEAARAPKWIFGNYVVIDAGGGRFVLLGHLMKGSVGPKVGDRVAVEQPVGRAGNSGNTMLPHLHVQVMDRADPADPEVSGLPAVVRDYVEILAHGTGTMRDATVRRVPSGDPPQDALVMRPESR
ncbi:MAG TPA: M23 family metallopeptidase [Candidatus Polarisedimenticolaceae bacterium]|nr:M23 family metallopeptidase [Candidatus Polarisedimenticolaceae bacterium]